MIDRHRDRFEVAGLAAGGSHVGLLAEQAASFHVPLVVVSNPQAEEPLRPALDAKGAHATQIRSGQDEVVALAGAGAPVVLNGITGSIGLEPSIAALQADSQLALANKESVVAGGHLLFDARTVNTRSIRWIPSIRPFGRAYAQVRMPRLPNSSSLPRAARSVVGHESR